MLHDIPQLFNPTIMSYKLLHSEIIEISLSVESYTDQLTWMVERQ